MDPSHHVAIVADGVAPLHPFQNRVAAALKWHMQIRRTLFQITNRVKQIVSHVLRVAGHELDSFDAIDVVQLVQ